MGILLLILSIIKKLSEVLKQLKWKVMKDWYSILELPIQNLYLKAAIFIILKVFTKMVFEMSAWEMFRNSITIGKDESNEGCYHGGG